MIPAKELKELKKHQIKTRFTNFQKQYAPLLDDLTIALRKSVTDSFTVRGELEYDYTFSQMSDYDIDTFIFFMKGLGYDFIYDGNGSLRKDIKRTNKITLSFPFGLDTLMPGKEA